MGVGDRAENRGEETKGKIKEGVGDVTDNDRLRREGKSDQGKAKMKDAVEDLKDGARRIFDKDR